MSRQTDLELLIGQSAGFIREYEQTKQLSDDPKEQARCDRNIKQQQELLCGYLDEYLRLCAALREAIPQDIRDTAISLGLSIPEPPLPHPRIPAPPQPGQRPNNTAPREEEPAPHNHAARPPVPFQLQFSRTSAGLEVRSSTPFMGEARAMVTLPPRQPVSTFAGTEGPCTRGRELYEALLVKDVRTALAAARNQARMERTTVALQLRFDVDAVAEAQYPWELLHDGHQFLLLSGVDLTRYITFPMAVTPVTVRPPLQVLLVAAAPRDLSALNVQLAQQILERLPHVQVSPLKPPTYRNLLRRLMPYQEPVHVFDFEGHGGVRQGQGGLCFEDDARLCDFVKADALGVALSGCQVALAVLNACRGADVDGVTVFNGVAPALILAGIPAVVGMQGAISDEAANDFFEALYEGVSRCLPVTTAVAHARKFLYPSGEWHKPALYLRSTDEEGKILVGCGDKLPSSTPPPTDPPFVTITLPDGRKVALTQEQLEAVDQVKLLKGMQATIGQSDFEILCFELGVSTANLPGATLLEKMKSLIEWHQQRGIYAKLVAKVIQARPRLYQQLCQ